MSLLYTCSGVVVRYALAPKGTKRSCHYNPIVSKSRGEGVGLEPTTTEL